MTEEWRLLELDALPGIGTQTIYHALGLAMEKYDDIENTIVICWPKNPVVCVGYHQIISEEVDLEYCQKNNLPVVRRPLGGGAVYLDAGQLFYQIIARLDNKKLPHSVSKLYETVLQAPIKTYREIGIPANYAPVNDIEANGKKISGNGAAEVGGARILTGNLIFDFNFDEMVKILKVPNEKFRDKIASSLRERLGTIKGFLGKLPDRQKVKKILIEKFEESLDISLRIEKKLLPKEKEIDDELQRKYLSEDWLNLIEHRRSELMEKRKVKISSSTQIYEAVYKAPGGLIRLFFEVEKEFIKDMMISGDFSAQPNNAPELIENSLIGTLLHPKHIYAAVSQVFQSEKVDIPGVTPDDFVKAVELSVKDLF
ncbi:MAG TPA: lipoate--protein ligase [Candidatus Bathyarchaeia archaeon]|nr:lipoate--protein ligase [Candidatus Bathyarchaeia archaeon]